jgi:hypothetical protein
MTEELTKTDYDYILLQYRLERGDELTEDERINATMVALKFGLEFDIGEKYNHVRSSYSKLPKNLVLITTCNKTKRTHYDSIFDDFDEYSFSKTIKNIKIVVIFEKMGLLIDDEWAIYPSLRLIDDDFNNGMSIIRDFNNLCGYINLQGEIVIQPQYNTVSMFTRRKRAIVSEITNSNSISYLIDNENNKISEGHNSIFPVSPCDKYYIINDGNYSGVIDYNNNLIIPVQYKGIEYVSEDSIDSRHDYFSLENDIQLEGLYDKKGNMVIGHKYDRPFDFHDKGFIVAYKDNKAGVIDINENIVIDFIYDRIIAIKDYRKHLIKVEKNEKWGIIDKTGKTIVPVKYEKVSFCDSGIIKAECFKKYTYDYYYKDGSRVPLK